MHAGNKKIINNKTTWKGAKRGNGPKQIENGIKNKRSSESAIASQHACGKSRGKWGNIIKHAAKQTNNKSARTKTIKLNFLLLNA